MVGRLLDIGRAVLRHGSMPSYQATLIEMRWKPFLDGLAAHVMKAVEDGRNGPPIRGYALDVGIEEAYQLTCAALDEVANRAGPNQAMLTALDDIAQRLSRWQAPAGPADGPGDAVPVEPAAPQIGELLPGARALAAAYQLKTQGKPVSLKAACELARVDRANLRANYPEAVEAIKKLGVADRAPRRGIRDRRTGDIDARDEDAADD
jgi:hypothetical protein